jgi:NADPH-dependent curcumin reductase CurA
MAKAMTAGACRVVGTAGSDAKIDWITNELGFDAGINYKAGGSVYAALKQACPSGVDCYFDNTGGSVTDAVFGLLNPFSRVAICGQISQYNNTQVELGPRPFLKILAMRATVRGFIVSDFFDRAEPARAAIAQWLRDGQIRYRDTIVDGLENAPAAFLGVLRGENTGKMLVRVKAE